MKSAIVAACLVAAAAVSTTPITAQSKLDFTLKNGTGLIITELYVSPDNTDDWEEDVLGRDVLRNGESVDITFSRTEKTCLWDLKIVDEDDDEVEWDKLDLCKASHIELQWRNGKATAIIK